METGDELVHLEHAWIRAVQRRDVAFLDGLLGEEFTLTTGRPGNETRSRSEYLEITRDAYRIESFTFEQLEVVSHGDAALVRARYSQRGSMAGEDWTQTFLMTDVFFRRAGRWQAVTRHVSPL